MENQLEENMKPKWKLGLYGRPYRGLQGSGFSEIGGPYNEDCNFGGLTYVYGQPAKKQGMVSNVCWALKSSSSEWTRARNPRPPKPQTR